MSMFRPINDFYSQLNEGECLVVMPISRLLLDEEISISPFRIYPAEALDTRDFKLNSIGDPQNLGLRELATYLTGFSVKVFENNPAIVFTASLDWDEFLAGDHQYDVALLKRLSAKGERLMDVIRFEFCRLDLPDTLPGLSGTWQGAEQYLGAIIYDHQSNSSRLIAGEAIVSTVIMKGLGLQLDSSPKLLLDASQGEVAAIAVHGLTLLSDSMMAGNDTVKFARVMTLLEFLANPNEYENWKSAKGNTICHCCNDEKTYHRLSERFREFTSIEDEKGLQKGYRTLIVHHGKFLEEIIPEETLRKRLFIELQGYVGKVLIDMLHNPSKTWLEFENYRETLKLSIFPNRDLRKDRRTD